MFSNNFIYSTTKTGKYVEELLLRFPQLITELKNSFWFDFYFCFCLGLLSKNYEIFLGQIAIS